MITKKEFLILAQHLYEDISFGIDGTFDKLDKKGTQVFDPKEAEKVKTILAKLHKEIK